MKLLPFLMIGSMTALVLLGAGCIKRTSPARLENGYTETSSEAPGRAYRDSEGNIIVPPATTGTITTSSTPSLSNMTQPLEIGPDGKGPTSTSAISH